MLKTTGSLNLASRELGTDEVVGGGGRTNKMVVDLSKSSKVEKPQKPKKFQR